MLAFSGVALAQQPGRFYGTWFSRDSGKLPPLVRPLFPKGSEKALPLFGPQKLPNMLQPKEPILIADRVVRLSPLDTPTVCSVPLVEAQIPKDVEFTIRQILPRPNLFHRMPLARIPAPPCE
jgi:hypothetical protein